MTLTRVEAAFKDLKSELGMRPIYHQKEERTTVTIVGEDKTIYSIQISGRPKTAHTQIFEYFEIKNKLKRVKTIVSKVSSD